jgi:hypothetical protein
VSPSITARTSTGSEGRLTSAAGADSHNDVDITATVQLAAVRRNCIAISSGPHLTEPRTTAAIPQPRPLDQPLDLRSGRWHRRLDDDRGVSAFV